MSLDHYNIDVVDYLVYSHPYPFDVRFDPHTCFQYKLHDIDTERGPPKIWHSVILNYHPIFGLFDIFT